MRFTPLPFLRHTAIFVVMAFSIATQASSPVSNVSSPVIKAGEASIEWRAGTVRDDGRNNHRLWAHTQLDYAPADSYALRLSIAQNKLRNDNIEHANIALFNRFQLIRREDHGWDGGVWLTYRQNDGDKSPNELELRTLASATVEGVQWTHNSTFSYDAGPDSRKGLAYEMANQWMTASPYQPSWITKADVGIELFDDVGKLRDLDGFDAQDHQLGPVLKADIADGWYAQTGYRRGLSANAPNHTFKLFVGTKF